MRENLQVIIAIIKAKVKAKTLEDAREDVETLRSYVHDLAEDARQIQPADPHEE